MLPTVLDVRNSAAVDAWVIHTIERFGKLDGAANLAGITGSGLLCGRPTRELDDQDWDLVLGINLTGVKNCVRGELKAMREAEGGSIVNAASVAGLKGDVGASCYAVSKAGVIALTKCAAKEEAPRGIRVNAVAPYVVSLIVSSAGHWLRLEHENADLVQGLHRHTNDGFAGRSTRRGVDQKT